MSRFGSPAKLRIVSIGTAVLAVGSVMAYTAIVTFRQDALQRIHRIAGPGSGADWT
jgi:hypothetical protein